MDSGGRESKDARSSLIKRRDPLCSNPYSVNGLETFLDRVRLELDTEVCKDERAPFN